MTGSGQHNSPDLQMPARREGLIERELENELILYDPGSDRAYLLNQVSAAIWDMCDGRMSVSRMAEEIAQHFAIPIEQALDDLHSALSQLLDEGVLTRSLA